jgi:methionyl-tRNA formyltransferase
MAMELKSRIIVLFGTSEFAVPVLEKLVQVGFRLALVVTTPDAPAGRKKVMTPPPVKVKALELGLKVYQPTNLRAVEAIEAIEAVKPDVGVVAAYGKIIPKAVIDLFSKGILNVHPSLLPSWRGPTPIQAAILAGDEKTGVTIMLIDEEMDHGPIVENREWRIENRETYATLYEKLAKLGADLLVETLPRWLAGELSPILQDHSKATYSKIFTREDAKIDWSKSAAEIDRMVRALNPEPGTGTQWQMANGKWQILKILRVGPIPYTLSPIPSAPGTVFEHEKRLAVRCKDGAVVLDIVQPEGKKPMSGADFLRGHREILGQVLQ